MSPSSPSSAASFVPPGMASADKRERADDELTRWFNGEIRPLEDMLRQYLRGRFPSLEPDDIIQEAYYRLLKARRTTPILNPRGFLIGIARHVAFEFLRRRRIFSPIPVNELPESATIAVAGDVIEAVVREQEMDLVAAAINTLPDRCREIVALRTLRHLSYPEIARELGLAEDTVRVQMARGIKKCVHHLRAQGITPEGEAVKRPAAPLSHLSPVEDSP